MDQFPLNFPSSSPSPETIPREPPWLQEACDHFWYLVAHDPDLERESSREYELIFIGYDAGGEPIYISRK